jgi:putative restriction endonuclease
LLERLAGLRRGVASGGTRAPHKPSPLLWLFGRFATTGSSAATYAQAEDPVSRLINDFGPPVASTSAARQRAALPFVHLERELWDLQDQTGKEIGPDAPERRGWLVEHGALGRLRPEVEQLLTDPATLAAAARLLLDQHFTPTLATLICQAVNLDLAGLEGAAVPGPAPAAGPRPGKLRRPGFAEEVLRAYVYRCAMCGFDGALGRNPVGIEAAHLRWHSHNGPDEVANGLALCALHHVLLDLGVLGLGAAHPRLQPVRHTQRGRTRRRCARRSSAARAAPRPARCRARPHRMAQPAGVQGRNHRSRVKAANLAGDKVTSPANATAPGGGQVSAAGGPSSS